MAVPQLGGFHISSFSQIDPSHPPPSPPPPPLTAAAAAAGAVAWSQEGPEHPQPFREEPQPYVYSQASLAPPEGDLNQPLDLRVSPREGPLLPASKRSAEEEEEEEGEGQCAKRARTEDAPNAHRSPPESEDGSGHRDRALPPPRDFYPQSYPSLASYGSPDLGRSFQETAQSDTPLSHHASPSSRYADGLVEGPMSYQQTVPDKGMHGAVYGAQAVVCSSALSGDDVKLHQELSADVSLGLPIPHNSVFSRAVSPLFQQSWHPSPMSVSSHTHTTLFHPAAASVSAHLHPDRFHSSLTLSSSAQQRPLPSAISASLHGQGDLLHAPVSQPVGFQDNVLHSPYHKAVPSSSPGVLPVPQNGTLPSPPKSILPFPPKDTPSAPQEAALLLSAPQNAVKPQQDALPSQQQLQQLPGRSLPQSSAVSPRPFYRPFEDTPKPSPQMSSTTVPVSGHLDSMSVGRDDSGVQDEMPLSSSGSVFSSAPVSVCSSEPSQTLYKSCTDAQRRKTEEEEVVGTAVPTQDEAKEKRNETPHSSLHTSDPGLAGFPSHNPDASTKERNEPLTNTTESSSPVKFLQAECTSPSGPNAQSKATKSPVQDNALVSSTTTCPEPLLTMAHRGKGKRPEARPFKVFGTTPLARVREERAKQEAKARQERLREFMARRHEYLGHGSQRCAVAADGGNWEAGPKIATTVADEEESSPPCSEKGASADGAQPQASCAKSDLSGPEPSSNCSLNDSNDREIPTSSEEDASSHVNSDNLETTGASSSTTDVSPKEWAGAQPNLDNTDSVTEAASEPSSSQPSPSSSSDSSTSKTSDGAPIPPDPNLKMSPLDYFISKVLVERIDVPFKPENREIREIYNGVKKGRLTLVDLIELQVEASLKA